MLEASLTEHILIPLVFHSQLWASTDAWLLCVNSARLRCGARSYPVRGDGTPDTAPASIFLRSKDNKQLSVEMHRRINKEKKNEGMTGKLCLPHKAALFELVSNVEHLFDFFAGNCIILLILMCSRHCFWVFNGHTNLKLIQITAHVWYFNQL